MLFCIAPSIALALSVFRLKIFFCFSTYTIYILGVIEVSCIEEEDGYIFMGSPLEIKQPHMQLTSGHSPESSGEGAQSDSDSESASSKSNHRLEFITVLI